MNAAWYLEQLGRMFRRTESDYFHEIHGLQAGIPRSRRNGAVCVEKLVEQGMAHEEIAAALNLPGSLSLALLSLPDAGWHFSYHN